MKTWLVVFVAALMLCGPALAQEKTKAAKTAINPEVITRVYDIGDLVMKVRDYPLTQIVSPHELMRDKEQPQQLFGHSSAPQTPDQATERNQQLVSLITSTVAPETWRDAGGTTGSIRVLDGQLIVTQTPENHQALLELLARLRGSGRMVLVEAHWVMLAPSEIDAILVKTPQREALQIVDRDLLSKLDAARHIRGQIVCFNGQLVHIASGRAQRVVTKLSPVVGNSAYAYDAASAILHVGASLEVRTMVVGDIAQVDLRSVVSDWDDKARMPTPGREATTQPSLTAESRSPFDLDQSRIDELEIRKRELIHALDAVRASGLQENHRNVQLLMDQIERIDAQLSLVANAGRRITEELGRLNLSLHEFKSTVRIPLGQPVLVGGMTADPTEGAKQHDSLYLVLEVTAATEK